MVKILLVLGLSILSAILYRMGGAKGYDTKFRDLGCPTISLITLFVCQPFILTYWWAYLLCFGLYFASLTTYFKKKGEDALWWNWCCVGLAFSLSFLPYAFISGCWLGFMVRGIVLIICIPLWSVSQGNAVREELGRGFLANITIPLLLIG
jgi:hypothetical protein